MLAHDIWRRPIDDAARALRLIVVTYCDQPNSKNTPRYFHANVKPQGKPSSVWRLKVVNSHHGEHQSIQDCNHYSNGVHLRLAEARSLRGIVEVPACWPVPSDSLRRISCSELIDGIPPSSDDLPLIVDVLVGLKARRRSLIDELGRLQSLATRPINRYGHREYRQRLTYSVRELVSKKSIRSEVAEGVVRTFDRSISCSVSEDSLTLAHGDFSYGNLKIRKGKLVLLDFEHSHIGLGEIDLAHLFVNLTVQGNNAAATKLIELFEEKSAREELRFDKGTFRALVLERVTGKMNSMSTRGEKWQSASAMLEAYVKETA